MGTIWLTKLAEVARRTGFPVVEVPGWQSRSRSSGGLDTFHGFSEHHTAESPMMDGAQSSNYQCFNASAKPISNAYVSRVPKIYIHAAGATNTSGAGGPWRKIPLNAANSNSFGLEIGNNGTGEVWPVDQQLCVVAFTAEMYLEYGAALGWSIDDIFAHFEYAPTRKIDPWGPSMFNDYLRTKWNMNTFREAVRQKAIPPVPPEPPTTPVTLTWVAATGDQDMLEFVGSKDHPGPTRWISNGQVRTVPTEAYCRNITARGLVRNTLEKPTLLTDAELAGLPVVA